MQKSGVWQTTEHNCSSNLRSKSDICPEEGIQVYLRALGPGNYIMCISAVLLPSAHVHLSLVHKIHMMYNIMIACCEKCLWFADGSKTQKI